MHGTIAIPAAVIALALASPAYAQSAVGWLEADQQRIVVANNALSEQRQVRFADAWETADYVPFQWRDLRGELVFLSARNDRVSLDFPLTPAEIPGLFRLGQAGEMTPGDTGRGSFLLGTAFGQRFAVRGVAEHCFSFLSDDAGQSASIEGRPQRLVYGYACSPAKAERPAIEQFLNDVDFVATGFVEAGGGERQLEATEDARDFALGRHARTDPPTGLVEVPLGYAAWEPIGGG